MEPMGENISDHERNPRGTELGKELAAKQALARFQKRIYEIMKVMEQEMDKKLIPASREQDKKMTS